MSDWTTTETFSNPDGSTTVHYCEGCGQMLAEKTVEQNDSCPTCGYPDEDEE